MVWRLWNWVGLVGACSFQLFTTGCSERRELDELPPGPVSSAGTSELDGLGGALGTAGTSPGADSGGSGSTESTAGAGGPSGSAGAGSGGAGAAAQGSDSGGHSSALKGGRTGSGVPLEVTGLPRNIEKLDLLFTIDSSRSMADKQALLQDAIPSLVRRLATPRCRDADGHITDIETGETGVCPAGHTPEFYPIKDIHIAIITSSLGAHGGDECVPSDKDPTVDDRGRPVGLLMRPGLTSRGWDESGFLAWDPGAKKEPPGLADRDALEKDFTDHLVAVGEVGCGYESTLESWYRFLIDPAPPLSVERTGDPSSPTVVAEGLDEELLAIRARFLRADSFLVITMLSDENDCSIKDEGSSWIVGTTADGFRMPRARAICEADPNDACCASCLSRTPAGCDEDPTCERPFLDASADHINLRCYDQKRRFGLDLLYPVSRYVNGLTEASVPDRSGEPRPNPLYASGERDPSRVFLVGIVGVPWQDVASEESFPADAPLEILSYEALEAEDRFDWMLTPDGASFPRDGLMYETPLDRTKVDGLPQDHPGTGAMLAPSGEATPRDANPINGKEAKNTDYGDLQFACIFPLPQPRECGLAKDSCDCISDEDKASSPLCNGDVQTHAKAYPGVRQLQVLRDFGKMNGNAVVASICPKVSDPELKTDPSYGYTPVLHALFTRLRRTRN